MATLLRCDRSKTFGSRITVYSSGRTLHCARGNELVVRVAVFDEAGAVLDLSDHSSLNLSYMAASRVVAAIATETASITNATFTEAQYLAGTHYHAEFTFSEADMNPSLAGALSVDHWLVCFGIKTTGGGEVTHGGGILTVEEDGTSNTVSTPEAPAVGITAAQAEALILSLSINNVVEDTTPQLGGTLDTNAKQIRESKGADVASATALTLGDDGNYFDITGTTTITSIATKAVGTEVTLHFDGALTLTHHATDLILPTGANITTAAGDEAVFREYATGDWRCISYSRASGAALVGSGLNNVVEDTTPQLGGTLDTNAKQIRESKGADVASASALTLGDDGNYFDITGTTTITSIATKGVGTVVTLHFDGILTLTHHATDLILPTGSSITTAAGDEAVFREYATGDWRCISYSRASGLPLAGGGGLSNVVEDTTPQLGGTLDTNAKQIRESKGADVASATSLTLGDDGNYFDITGTTTITSIATKAVGTVVTLHFDGALTLTHHATDLILPTGANITTAAGDEAVFREYATGDWRCISYTRASGAALVASGLSNVVEDTTPQLGGTLETNAKQIRESKGADVASASALTLGDDGNYFDITGTTTITSIATKGIGTVVTLHFDGILTLTHHATDLILPTGANITTAAGDEAVFREYATGDWRCISYSRASGLPLAGGGGLSNVVEDTTPQLGGTLDANSHQIQQAKGADVASATTLTLGTDGNYFNITGTTTITGINTLKVGTQVVLRFGGVMQLTNGGSFNLPVTGNVTTAVGDHAFFREYSTGVWVCESYMRASGESLMKTPRITAQAYTGGLQNLSTTYADVSGSSITYTRVYSSSLILYKFNFQAAPGDAGGSAHFTFYVAGAEQTAWRKTFVLPTSDNILQFEAAYTSSASGSLALKLQAREYSASAEIKLHETSFWDGAASSQSSGAVLTIIEIPT